VLALLDAPVPLLLRVLGHEHAPLPPLVMAALGYPPVLALLLQLLGVLPDAL